VREALAHAYPTGEIGDLLADIERGYADAHSAASSDVSG
jgi:hypothetical protein